MSANEVSWQLMGARECSWVILSFLVHFKIINNLHGKGCWKMSKMEVLDPLEAKKFKKQKCIHFCRSPCIYDRLIWSKCYQVRGETFHTLETWLQLRWKWRFSSFYKWEKSSFRLLGSWYSNRPAQSHGFNAEIGFEKYAASPEISVKMYQILQVGLEGRFCTLFG